LFAYAKLGPVAAASVAVEFVAVSLCRGVSECWEHDPFPSCQLRWRSCLLLVGVPASASRKSLRLRVGAVHRSIGISCRPGRGADLESPSVGADYGDAADAGWWPGCLGGFVILHATSVGLRP
jgi:hypothetical protein